MAKRKGIGSHQSSNMKSDEYLTPPEIIKSCGDFDLDPCAPIIRPWDMAKNHFTINDDGLSKEWNGRVWCNPPYGRQSVNWLNKCADYRNATALIFARTETNMFFDQVWDKAYSVLFIRGRLTFYDIYGNLSRTVKGEIANSGAPSVLIAYDEYKYR